LSPPAGLEFARPVPTSISVINTKEITVYFLIATLIVATSAMLVGHFVSAVMARHAR
jgi:hypothetical protein